jgi:hypothetical protein
MTSQGGENGGCLLVGENLEGAEIPPDATCRRGEVKHPNVVFSYLDIQNPEPRRSTPIEPPPNR